MVLARIGSFGRTQRRSGPLACGRFNLWRACALVVAVLWLANFTVQAAAAETVYLVVSPQAPALEGLAAEELSSLLTRVYGVQVQVVPQMPGKPGPVVFLGRPATNAALRPLAPQWPQLPPQGYQVRSVSFSGQTVLWIGGATPAATLWAVYEFGHQAGVRNLLMGDFDPTSPPMFSTTGFDLVRQPLVETRTWRTLGDSPVGPASWGLEEQKKFIRQLSAVGFNRLLLAVEPWQPFVEFRSGTQPSKVAGTWAQGLRLPVDGDTSGRAAFGGARWFENPDLPCQPNTENQVVSTSAGQAYLRSLIVAAQQQGLSAALEFSPWSLPRELAIDPSSAGRPVPEGRVPNAVPLPGSADLAIGPGPQIAPDEAAWQSAAKAQWLGYLGAYSQVSAFYVPLNDTLDWSGQSDAAGGLLVRLLGADAAGVLSRIIVADAASEKPEQVANRQRMRSQLVKLAFTEHMLREPVLVNRASPVDSGADLQVVYTGVDRRLAPLLALLPPARQVVYAEVTEAASSVPAGTTAANPSAPGFMVPLGDNYSGLLPQMDPDGLLQTLAVQLPGRPREIITGCWNPSDAELSVYLLSRACWGQSLSLEDGCRQWIAPVCGEGVDPRVLKAVELVSQATRLMRLQQPDFSVPRPNMLLDQLKSPAIPTWHAQARECYVQAMNEMYRANTRAREGARTYTLHFARRCEFALEYLNCVEALHKTAAARAAGDTDLADSELEKAIDSLHGGLSALAAVVRSNSDRGTIAILNLYGYRPLLEAF